MVGFSNNLSLNTQKHKFYSWKAAEFSVLNLPFSHVIESQAECIQCLPFSLNYGLRANCNYCY